MSSIIGDRFMQLHRSTECLTKIEINYKKLGDDSSKGLRQFWKIQHECSFIKKVVGVAQFFSSILLIL